MAVAVAGCRNSIEMNNEKEGLGVSWDQLNSAPWVDVHKENFPEWMVIKINEYEEMYDSLPFSFFTQIFKGEWNNQTIYFIRNPYSACECDFYYEDKEQVDSRRLDNLYTTSKNWSLIWKIGEQKNL